MNQSTRGDDALFGPQLPGRFDFTLLFEQSIFTALPCSLFLVAAMGNIYGLCKQPVRVKSGALLWLKLGTVLALLATQIASAVLSQILDTKMTVAASALSCLSSAALLPLLYMEHRRSVRSSSMVGLFLSVTMLFDATRARSYGMRGDLGRLAALAGLEAAWKLGVLLLEEVSKKSLVRSDEDRLALGPEMTSGFWNRSLFVWLNEMLLLGFKNAISVNDLPEMGQSFESELLHEQFQQEWRVANKESRYGLLFALAKTMKWSLLVVVIPRLCFSAFTYMQPLLLQTVVSSVQEKQQQEVVGGLIGATVLVYFGLAVTRACYQHLIYRSVTLMRGHMVSAILDKATRLRLSEAKKAAAATLMNADIQGLATGITYLHNIWASVLELGVGIYLLARLVGAASFLVAVPAAIITVLSMAIAKKMGPARMVWMKAIQKRVSGTSAILGQLKAIKMAGMAVGVAKSVQNLRVIEVARSVGFRRISVVLFGLSEFSQAITPVVVLAGGIFWTGSSKQLHAADIFATLSVIALVSSPLNTLLTTAPALVSIMSSVDRLQKFLLQDEAADMRERLGRRVSGSQPGPEEEGTELQDLAKQGVEMELTDGDVPAGDKTEALLHKVNLSVKTGSLVMITGAVGSGKSVLLKAILGEGRINSGSLAIRTDDMAYCDQSAWLRNVSIRNNIIAHSGDDEKRYDAVLRACLLDEDMLQIPGGDSARAGSDGINLSGGQKQRIALARAIYSQRPVLVLDDVFSALDETTAKSVFQRVFGKDGLVRSANATVIMATHATSFYHEADQLISISEGKVSEIDVPLPPQQVEQPDEDQAEPTAAPSAPQPPSSSKTKQPAAVDKQRQLGDLSLYSFYVQACGTNLFMYWILLVAISCVWTKMPNIFVSIWLAKDPSNNTFFAGYAALGGTGVLFGMFMLFIFMFKLVPASAANLHWMLVDTVVKATLPFLSATDSGSILNRFGQDMTLVNQSLPRAVSQTAIRLFTVIIDLVLIVAGAKYAAAAIPLLLLVLYVVQKYYLRTSRQMRHLDLEAKAPLFTQLTETASGSEHIRAFRWQTQTRLEGFKLLDVSQRPYYHMFAIQRWLELVLDLCVLGIAVIVVSLALSFTETTSQAAVGLALLNVISFSTELSLMLQMWIDLETSLGAVSRVKSFTRDTPLEEEPENAYAMEASWPRRGAIEFTNVTARYKPDDSESRPALDDISVKIEPGQKVGIVGRTGSGKSSLLLTLLHMLEYQGSITIDGVEVSSMNKEDLRAHVTTITQDAISLEGSVQENLLPFQEGEGEGEGEVYSDADVDMTKESLQKVGLWEHISAQGGLEASLSAVGLSQGQKQLLSLAKALLHHHRGGGSVVLVDEATSSVDGETDKRMQEVMNEAFAKCTVLTIAHRLETLSNADVLLELNAGKVNITSRTQ